jgi:hypothetical protein
MCVPPVRMVAIKAWARRDKAGVWTTGHDLLPVVAVQAAVTSEHEGRSDGREGWVQVSDDTVEHSAAAL